MTYLVLHQLQTTRGDRVILNDMSFQVAEGEFLAILGPSGCGKTTLLRTLAGLETSDHGQIYLQQQEVGHLPPSQRKLAMVFQSYALFPHLSIRENLLFGLRARREDRQSFQQRLSEVVELLELGNYLDRRPGELSGGQQQRVALGRAIIARPKLCLMDEPLSNLDARLRQTMRREIRQLQQKLGLTMLYVTHDQTEAMSMADRILLMNQGRTEQLGTPADLYLQPASEFVAGFIGAPPMNLFPLSLVHPQRCFPPVSAEAEFVTLGLRAEAMTLTAPAEGRLKVTIISHEFMGADTRIQCQPEGSQAILTVKMNGLRHFTPGTLAGLDWQAQAEYRFDRRTGLRIAGPATTTDQGMALHAFS
ncbi:ABC transporter ATP-binding protein [Tatumella sp. UBA2305]|uniref:ABC transporter ATP-binding protein n=1 Tax=Tatumella sp. UBA2305 TaxID=1947647 RepID=UPI0025E39FCA|nr:ABC transporter ATP-binding protein [Tatumella sp. UBA2305]